MLRTSLGLLLIIGLASCGPKSTGPGLGAGGVPAPVAVYAGLRFVPGDATYVLATRRVEDGVLVARELIDALGILGEFDAAEAGRESADELGGLDLLSTASLTDHGIDVARGAAVFSRGLSPTFVIPLSDPQRFAAFIEERRGGGAVVQVSRAHDLDVYTFRPGRREALHWTFAGDWFLAHFEVGEEHEADGAWLDVALAARGGFAAEADFTAALTDGQHRLGGEPAVVAVARVPAILAHPLVVEPAGCADTIGKLGRVFAVASVVGGDAQGAIVAELPAGADGVRALRLPVPAGWATARAEAPIQVEAGLDLRAAAQLFGACVEDDLVDEIDPLRSMHGGRAFVFRFDPNRMEGRGAVVVELTDPKLLDEALDEIPGLSFMRKKRVVAGIEVFDVDVPMVGRFSYARVGKTVIAGMDGTIDGVLAGGMGTPTDELARIELHPQRLSPAEWDAMLAPLVSRERAREHAIRRVRRWKHGRVMLGLEGSALVLSANGQR